MFSYPKFSYRYSDTILTIHLLRAYFDLTLNYNNLIQIHSEYRVDVPIIGWQVGIPLYCNYLKCRFLSYLLLFKSHYSTYFCTYANFAWMKSLENKCTRTEMKIKICVPITGHSFTTLVNPCVT